MSTPPADRAERIIIKRRRRAARSCDVCRRLKIKCDLMKPKCNWCFHHDLACTFSRTTEVAGDNVNRESPETQTHVTPITQSNQDLPTRPVSVASITPISEQEPPLGSDLNFAGESLGNIHAFNGLPFFSESGRRWIKECSGEDLNLPNRPPLENSFWQSLVTACKVGSPDYVVQQPMSLPDINDLRDDIYTYRTSAFSLFFPIIDPVIFEDTIKAAYRDEAEPSPATTTARASVFAFSALVFIMVRKIKGPTQIMGERFTREAHRLIARVLNKSMSAEGIQTLIMVGICSQAIAGDLFVIDSLLGIAVRFVVHLKANFDPYLLYGKPTRMQRHLRTIFWVTYLCDKALTLGTDHAPMLPDSNCDLTLPTELMRSAEECPVFGEPYPGTFLHSSIRLAFIHSRIYQGLYSPNALRQSNADLLRTIRDLDRDIDKWRESVPSNLRPSMAPGNQAPELIDMRTAVWQLNYHHSMVMIHQASSRCPSWTENQDTRGMYSSLAISVVASRSLLQKFLDNQMDLDSHNLLFSLSFMIHAIVILFCNILSNPLDPENVKDMRLVFATPKLIKEVHDSSTDRPYSADVEFAECVGIELRRIAQAAMKKALRDVGIN